MLKKQLLFSMPLLLCVILCACLHTGTDNPTIDTNDPSPDLDLPKGASSADIESSGDTPSTTKDMLGDSLSDDIDVKGDTSKTDADAETVNDNMISCNYEIDATVAKAYYDVVKRLLDEYGECKIIDIGWEDNAKKFTGLCVVRLIDFDGDGNYELYCVYQNHDRDDITYYQDIYAYSDEKGIFQVMSGFKVSNPATCPSPTVEFLYKEGKTCLVLTNEMTEGDYYTIENSRLVSLLNYVNNDDEGTVTLNGTLLLNYTEWDAALDEFTSGCETESFLLAFDINNDNLAVTQETIKYLKQLSGQ